MDNTNGANVSQCSVCHTAILPNWYFCPNCGKAFKEKPPNITVFKQVYIYAISFFLAPLGLGWGLKYIRSSDQKTRTVGMISIALTVVSILLIIMVFKNFADQYGKMLNNIGNFNGNLNLPQ